MSLDGGEVVKLYLENLAGGFSCQSYGEIVVITTPYLYHDDDMIYVAVKELPGGKVKVTDQGEAVMHPFSHGFDLARSPWGMETAREIARDEFVELDGGTLSKTGPVEEVGRMILDVVTAARGVSDLIYAHRAYARIKHNRPAPSPSDPVVSFAGTTAYTAFLENLELFLVESDLKLIPSPKRAGGSGQVYTVHYCINGAAYLQSLNPSRAARAKAAVDRAFSMWADCNGGLTRDRKLTLLNDETFAWKAAHINRLSQVSTVVRWSERDQLPALLSALS